VLCDGPPPRTLPVECQRCGTVLAGWVGVRDTRSQSPIAQMASAWTALVVVLGVAGSVMGFYSEADVRRSVSGFGLVRDDDSGE
jgi:hypothetical protein